MSNLKRILIAMTALSMALSACSFEDETEVEETVEETEATAVGTSDDPVEEAQEDRHQFEVGMSKADKREARKQIDEVFAKELDKVSSENPVHSTMIDTVEVDVTGAELYDFANGTHLQIDFAVENTVDEPKQLPLERAIVVTNTGVQAEGERQLSDAPEWDMKGAVKSEGFVVFDLGKEPIEDIESVTLIIPGVDFRTDLEERIEINL